MDNAARRYILTPAWSFRGWKKLPYAVQSLYYPKTEFFGEADWKLFSACDGQTDIDWAELTDAQRGRYDYWEQNGFICRASDGERLRPSRNTASIPPASSRACSGPSPGGATTAASTASCPRPTRQKHRPSGRVRSDFHSASRISMTGNRDKKQDDTGG